MLTAARVNRKDVIFNGCKLSVNVVELRDLEYFAVVAEHGSLTAASESLELSPAALSKSLQRLEKAVNARLFERTSKGVLLTAAGRALLGRVERVRLVVNEVAREAAELDAGRTGEIRIGVGEAEADLLPMACAPLLRDSPGLRLEISVSNNDVMVPRLLEGELELILNFLQPRVYEGTVQEPLFDDEFVICASAHHRLAGRKAVTIHDVASERWMLTTGDSYFHGVLVNVLGENGLPAPSIAVEARSLRVRLLMWGCSNLLGISSRRVLRREAKAHGLVQLPVKGLTWRRPVGIIYRKEGYLPQAARRLVQSLKEAGQSLAAHQVVRR